MCSDLNIPAELLNKTLLPHTRDILVASDLMLTLGYTRKSC
jgi:hypothetical protein